jgi:hypothetical protein
MRPQLNAIFDSGRPDLAPGNTNSLLRISAISLMIAIAASLSGTRGALPPLILSGGTRETAKSSGRFRPEDLGDPSADDDVTVFRIRSNGYRTPPVAHNGLCSWRSMGGDLMTIE